MFVPEWIWMLLIGTVVLGLIGLVYNGISSRIGSLEKWREEHGSSLPTRVSATENAVIDIREWKHRVVDPYVPRAIDDMKERVDRLDRKVFNGYKGG